MYKVALLLTITCLAPASWLSAGPVATSDEVESLTTMVDFELAKEDVEQARAFIGMLRRDAGPGGPFSISARSRSGRALAELGSRERHLQLELHSLQTTVEQGRLNSRLQQRIGELRLLAQNLRHEVEERLSQARNAQDRFQAEYLALKEGAAPWRPSVPPEGPVVNDDCSSAIVIGDGTFMGTTSGANTDGSATCGSSDAAPDVWYSYTATQNGSVSFDTFDSTYDTVLSLHMGCPGTTGNELSCSDDYQGLESWIVRNMTIGETVLIRVAGYHDKSGDFTLNVRLTGAISGTVIDEDTTNPLAGVGVNIYRANGSFAGSGFTDGSGNYLAGNLVPGTYFAVTSNFFDYLDEAYDGVSCPNQSCDVTSTTPIVVSAGATTSDIDFALIPGGSISGSLTEDPSGTPLGFQTVTAFTKAGSPVGSSFTDSSGFYTIGGLATGDYVVRTQVTSNHLDELYDDLPCGSSCDVTTGTTIGVIAGMVTPNIDFALLLGGSISGTLTDADTMLPLAFHTVSAYDATGLFARSSSSDVSGNYTIPGLAGGDYFVATRFGSPYLDEVYDDTLCVGFSCDPTIGTPVSVTVAMDTPGIDFALDLGGTVSGTVTEDPGGPFSPDGGAALMNVSVGIYDATGQSLAFDFTDGNGVYQAEGLPSGDYFARTFAEETHLDEIYDDLPCIGFCDPTTGTSFGVVQGSDTPGIDFALLLSGTISGVVTDAATALPLSNASVSVYDQAGLFVGSDRSDGTGNYTVGQLRAGNHFASIVNSGSVASYQNQLYDNLPCFPSCDRTTGTSIVVTQGANTPNIDFGLRKGGSIEGLVVDGSSMSPLAGVSVLVYTETGDFVRSSNSDDYGHHGARGLPTGNYFARTFGDPPYLNELWDDILCEPSCNVTSGTPIAVIEEIPTTDINFGLSQGGSISGLVTAGTVGNAPTGATLDGVTVYIWDSTGSFVGTAISNASGMYRLGGLLGGTYFATSLNSQGYIDELYDNIPCAFQTCDVTTGTPIMVILGQDSPNINFELDAGGSISGLATRAAGGAPISGLEVEIYGASGSYLTNGLTDGIGAYSAGGLPSGTYYARTNDASGLFDDQLYDGLPCEPTCDPTTGTPIVVTAPSSPFFPIGVDGIDFQLILTGSLFFDGFESGDTSGWSSQRP